MKQVSVNYWMFLPPDKQWKCLRCSQDTKSQQPVRQEKTGPGPRTAYSCIDIRQKAKPPPCFTLNEAMMHGGMTSKTEILQHLNKELTRKTVEHVQ